LVMVEGEEMTKAIPANIATIPTIRKRVIYRRRIGLSGWKSSSLTSSN
jgi:hypothetical protein